MSTNIVTKNESLATHSAPRVSPEPEALLTVHDVALMLKVPASWVYEHTRPGCRDLLPHVKLGKYLRFFAADILDYLKAIRANNRHRR